LLYRQIIWWLYQCTAVPLCISTNGCYLSHSSAVKETMQHLLHYSRCSLSAWIDCLNFQNRLRLTHYSYFCLSLSFLVLYICTYIHTIIHKYSCWIFTLDFFIHMWIFFDPVSVILCAQGPTQNPAWRNVSMGSNISYRTDTRQSTKSVEVWFHAAMIPVIIYMTLYSLFIIQVLGQCLRGLQDECSNTAVTSSKFILLIHNIDI